MTSTMNEIVGQNVTIRVLLQKGGDRYFNGFISSFAQTAVGRAASDEIYSSYRATMVPWLWLLTRTANCRIFQEMTVPDIIKKIFGDYGFSGFVEDRLTGKGHIVSGSIVFSTGKRLSILSAA